jgi:hydrogenase expression/formation protein HypC
MCLGIPMKIVAVDPAGTGTVELDGVRHAVDLSLIEGPQTGDHVIVHAGFAIERLDPAEADARIELFQSLAASRERGEG